MSVTDFDNVAKWSRFIQSLPLWQKLVLSLILVCIIVGWLYIFFGPLRTAQGERDRLAEELKQINAQLATVRDEKATVHRELLSYKEILDPIQKKAVQLYPELETAAALGKIAQEIDAVRTLATQDTYRPLADTIKTRVVQQLKAVQLEVGTNLAVEVAVESGSASRQRVANALVGMLAEAGISVTGPRPVITVFSGVPSNISIELNSEDLELANQVVSPLGLFVNERMSGVNRPKEKRGLLRIHIVGDPLFSPEGVVTFR